MTWGKPLLLSTGYMRFEILPVRTIFDRFPSVNASDHLLTNFLKSHIIISTDLRFKNFNLAFYLKKKL